MNESIEERLTQIGEILATLPTNTSVPSTIVNRQIGKLEYQDVNKLEPLYPFVKSTVFVCPRNIEADHRPNHIFKIQSIDTFVFIPKDRTKTKAFCWIQDATKQKLWVEANTPEYIANIEGVIYLLEMLDNSATI